MPLANSSSDYLSSTFQAGQQSIHLALFALSSAQATHPLTNTMLTASYLIPSNPFSLSVICEHRSKRLQNTSLTVPAHFPLQALPCHPTAFDHDPYGSLTSLSYLTPKCTVPQPYAALSQSLFLGWCLYRSTSHPTSVSAFIIQISLLLRAATQVNVQCS